MEYLYLWWSSASTPSDSSLLEYLCIRLALCFRCLKHSSSRLSRVSVSSRSLISFLMSFNSASSFFFCANTLFSLLIDPETCAMF